LPDIYVKVHVVRKLSPERTDKHSGTHTIGSEEVTTTQLEFIRTGW